MKYKILIDNTDNINTRAKNLSEKVNEHLNKGWSLYGDVQVYVYVMVQTMIKTDLQEI